MSDIIQTILSSIKSLKGSPLPLEDLSGESLGDNLSHFPVFTLPLFRVHGQDLEDDPEDAAKPTEVHGAVGAVQQPHQVPGPGPQRSQVQLSPGQSRLIQRKDQA